MRAEVRDQSLPFDSILRGDTLTLVLHVMLVPTAPGVVRTYPPQSNREPRTTKPWPPNRWAGWPERWKAMMLEAWHDKFELHAATALRRQSDPRRLRCHFELHVEGVDDTFQAPGHLRSRVDFHGTRRRDFEVSSARLNGNRNRNEFDMTLDYRDIVGDDKGVGPQYSAIHELGHHLGLGHRCHGTSDEYCTSGPRADRRDVMASGNEAKPWHAEPWLRRLHAHRYHQDVNWYAVVKGDSQRSGLVRPGADAQRSNLVRQEAMKQTAALDPSDVDSLIAPPPAGARTPRATRRRGFWASVAAALGMPQRR